MDKFLAKYQLAGGDPPNPPWGSRLALHPRELDCKDISGFSLDIFGAWDRSCYLCHSTPSPYPIPHHPPTSNKVFNRFIYSYAYINNLVIGYLFLFIIQEKDLLSRGFEPSTPRLDDGQAIEYAIRYIWVKNSLSLINNFHEKIGGGESTWHIICKSFRWWLNNI